LSYTPHQPGPEVLAVHSCLQAGEVARECSSASNCDNADCNSINSILTIITIKSNHFAINYVKTTVMHLGVAKTIYPTLGH